MADTKVESDYHVVIPEEVRSYITIGQRYIVTVSPTGSLLLTPAERRYTAAEIADILNRTAGLWRDRVDIPEDGVDYVNELRQSRRFNDIMDIRDGR
jgi:hypothetical protein